MISQYVSEILSKFNICDKIKVRNNTPVKESSIKIINSDFLPESGDDIVLELSNGKNIKASDLEFCQETNSGYIILGPYTFILNE